MAIRRNQVPSLAISGNQCQSVSLWVVLLPIAIERNRAQSTHPIRWLIYHKGGESAHTQRQLMREAINTPQKAAEASTERSAVYGKARQRPRRRRGSSPRGTCGAWEVGAPW